MNETSPQPIICGTDLSESAAHAADVAAVFATRLNAPLLLVHGIDERGELASKDWPEMTDRCRPQLHAEAERLRQGGAEVEEIVAAGVPDDGIAYRAERANARMIVLASAGYSALDRWSLGSVAERIAESAWVPTLVVRQDARLKNWARGSAPLRVFIGADFTAESDAAMAWAASLREIGPCEYAIAFVDRSNGERARRPINGGLADAEGPHESLLRDLQQRAAAFLPKQTVYFRVLPASGRVDHHLLELAEQVAADLIVVGTHQWHGLTRILHPSVSRRLLRAASVSVACVPNRGPVAKTSPCVSKAHRALVITDLSPHGNAAIPYAFSMLQRGGTACFLSVTDTGEAREAKLEQLRALLPAEADGQGFHIQTEVATSGNIAETICDAARRLDVDLICLGARDFSTNSTTPLSTTALAVLTRSSCPVLVVPQTAAATPVRH